MLYDVADDETLQSEWFQVPDKGQIQVVPVRMPRNHGVDLCVGCGFNDCPGGGLLSLGLYQNSLSCPMLQAKLVLSTRTSCIR